MSVWLTIFGCSPQAGPKLGGSIFFLPKWNRDATDIHGTITDIFPSHSQNPKLRLLSLLLPHFLSSFGSWHKLLHAGWELPPAAGSARDGVGTMLHLVPEGYCRHFYNIYNRTGHSVLQRLPKT